MAREIKFRAWDNIHSKMIGPSVNMLVDSYSGKPWWHFGYYDPDPMNVVIMQYTGLKDSKGVEIWEGDVLCFTYGEQQAEARDVVYSSVVYRNGGFRAENPVHRFYLSEIDGLHEVRWTVENTVFGKKWYYSCEDIRVIGNIYENPELLTTQEETE